MQTNHTKRGEKKTAAKETKKAASVKQAKTASTAKKAAPIKAAPKKENKPVTKSKQRKSKPVELFVMTDSVGPINNVSTVSKKPPKGETVVQVVKVKNTATVNAIILPQQLIAVTKGSSILDEENEPTATLRYSDSDLQEFKALIETQRQSAQSLLDTLRADLNGINSHSSESGMLGVQSPMEKEEVINSINRQLLHIENLNKALVRVELKTYGICRITGKMINKQRLYANPIATTEVNAKILEQKSNPTIHQGSGRSRKYMRSYGSMTSAN